jgi:N-acetylmuramoyl-L-alanine amidase
MRKTVPALLVVALVPALLVLPVVTAVHPKPHPVAPHVVSESLSGVDASSLKVLQAGSGTSTATGARTATAATVVRAPAVLTPELATAPYQLLGITWDTRANSAGFKASVRIRTASGTWGAWEPLSIGDAGPDAGSVDARQGRVGTEPLVTGPSDGVQVRVDTTSGLPPAGIKLELVDPGTSAADAEIGASDPASSAVAAMTQPKIISRAQWGADESLRNGFAGYSDTIKVGFVHHTVSQNTYTSAAGAAQQIRAIYAYDTNGLGWSDIAYNFLVDKFGNIYEGRAGGITLAVIGAHTAGFNYESFAVAALGCFDTTCSGGGLQPPAAMTTSIAKVLAWKLGLFYRDPQSSAVLTSSGITGTNLHHPAGQLVTTPTISGHRDVDATACPGNLLYPLLPAIRVQAENFLAAGLVAPSLSAGSGNYSAAGPTVHAGVITSQTWGGVVTDICRGGTVEAMPSGSATRALPITTAWNGKSSGSASAMPGPYRITMTSASANGTALPWSAIYAVNAPPPGAATPGSAITGDGGFVPVTPVRILDTRSGVYANGPGGRIDVKVLGKGGIPASGVTSVFLTVTATCATAPSYLNAYAGGTTAPATSNVNFSTGQTRAALVAVPVGADGTISIGNSAGTSQILVDVLGYGSAVGGAELTPVPLTRVYDTRSSGAGSLTNGEARTLTLPAIAGIPAASISSVVANITVYSPTASGYLAVYPGGTPWPGTSTLNYPAGLTMDTSVVVKVVNGTIVLRNVGPSVDAAVDVIGVYAPHAVKAGGRFTAIAADRVLDTRSGGPLTPGYTLAVTVAGGTTSVPLGVRAVLVNLTGVKPTESTSLIGWPFDGSAMPGGAFLRVGASDIRANVAVVAVAPDGRILLNNAVGTTNVIVDVLGYYQ